MILQRATGVPRAVPAGALALVCLAAVCLAAVACGGSTTGQAPASSTQASLAPCDPLAPSPTTLGSVLGDLEAGPLGGPGPVTLDKGGPTEPMTLRTPTPATLSGFAFTCTGP